MLKLQIRAGARLRFNYTNYRGELSARHATMLRLDYGSTPHHEEEQWFLHCFDFDKRAYRSFALKDIELETFQIVED